ncbi:MAG TPA: SAM-dependent methyltransferase [Acetobacteraceae bacterium]|jgi:cyclopropane-fatty-acyl-phospholipid synthase|nr:SAM-dependent methyltransferase [Acetobacteraceae bacterium]
MSDVSIEVSLPVAPDLGWLARRLSRTLFSRVHTGRFTIVTPSGMRLSHEGKPGPEGVLVLRRWRTLRRLLFQGDIAFAEAFMDGDWDSPDLPALIELAGSNMPTLSDAFDANWFHRLRNRWLHRLNANTKRGSKRNIRHHYDLGNAFYRTWLDAGMSYSSAIFASRDQSLEDAQLAKQQRAIALMETQPGQTVLEIGCGWGGLAEQLVRSAGCSVTGVTLSPAQLAYATERLGDADLRLQDYRDVSGQFDRIVSIEMMEAVGEAYWPSYFATLRDRLKPGGLAVIQAITISEAQFEGYRRCTDFIQQYIFPGGMLPTITEIRRQADRAGMKLRSIETFGSSYAWTLAEWRKRFHAAWPRIERMGFDTRFRRMWDYYLAYCEGGFRAGTINVGLYVMEKPA